MKKQAGKKNNIISILALLFSSLFILAGCGSGSSGSSGSSGGSGTTPVSISLNIPNSGISAAESSFSGVVTQSTPTVVSSIEMIITGPNDEELISDTFNVSHSETVTKTYDVPSVANITIVARAFGGLMGTGSLLYEGITTAADLSGEPVAVSLNMVLSDILRAIEALESGDIVGARDLFRAAVSKYAGEGSDNENIANFFYAITRVLAPWFDMEYEEINDGVLDLNVITELIKNLSCGQEIDCSANFNTINNPVDAYFAAAICPENLPSGFPTGQELQDFLYNVLFPELTGAIGNFANVMDTFNYIWTEPFDSTTVESDYSDVLFLRAIGDTAMAALEVEDAARSAYLMNAMDDIEKAINRISEEPDEQENDWINLIDKDPLEMLGILNDIETARECNEPLDG